MEFRKPLPLRIITYKQLADKVVSQLPEVYRDLLFKLISVWIWVLEQSKHTTNWFIHSNLFISVVTFTIYPLLKDLAVKLTVKRLTFLEYFITLLLLLPYFLVATWNTQKFLLLYSRGINRGMWLCPDSTAKENKTEVHPLSEIFIAVLFQDYIYYRWESSGQVTFCSSTLHSVARTPFILSSHFPGLLDPWSSTT